MGLRPRYLLFFGITRNLIAGAAERRSSPQLPAL